MARRLYIFRDTETGEELVMPVTPGSYEIQHGRKVASVTMYGAGDVNLPGELSLLNTKLEFLLPAQAYPFVNEGANLNPFTYIERFERWSDAGRLLRFIISDTPVNAAVLLEPITYGEDDGTKDITMSVTLRGSRALDAETTQRAETGNAARAEESQPQTQDSYIVVSGDTLSGIAKRFYGDASLCYKLATANGIANPNLIYPGQVIDLPPLEQLSALQATTPPASVQVSNAVSTKSTTSTTSASTSGGTESESATSIELDVRDAAELLSLFPASNSSTVYIVMTENRYHRIKNCSQIKSKMGISSLTLAEAKSKGYTACPHCFTSGR